MTWSFPCPMPGQRQLHSWQVRTESPIQNLRRSSYGNFRKTAPDRPKHAEWRWIWATGEEGADLAMKTCDDLWVQFSVSEVPHPSLDLSESTAGDGHRQLPRIISQVALQVLGLRRGWAYFHLFGSPAACFAVNTRKNMQKLGVNHDISCPMAISHMVNASWAWLSLQVRPKGRILDQLELLQWSLLLP